MINYLFLKSLAVSTVKRLQLKVISSIFEYISLSFGSETEFDGVTVGRLRPQAGYLSEMFGSAQTDTFLLKSTARPIILI